MTMLDRVKERAPSEQSDVELQAMIDAITAELDARLGPVGAITVELGDPGDPDNRTNRTLRLNQPADTDHPVTIIERDPGNSGDPSAAVELAAGDYRLLHGGRTLQRLPTGPNGRSFWAPLVEITYTPKGVSQAARDEATIKLMQIDLSYRGMLKSERAGDYQFTLSGDPVADRNAIIDGLAQRGGMVMA